MTSPVPPIPPINVNPNTNIDMQDSCNCCWGRKVKPKPPLNRSNARADVFTISSPKMPKDANEVYDLHVSVNYHSKRDSNEDTPKHVRNITRYPQNIPDGYEADSTQSTKEEQ